ncbi:hypothetical protein PO909_031750, partial [Leuciscus waleckii]
MCDRVSEFCSCRSGSSVHGSAEPSDEQPSGPDLVLSVSSADGELHVQVSQWRPVQQTAVRLHHLLVSSQLHLRPTGELHLQEPNRRSLRGKRVFLKRVFCNWTGGYKWSTALALSITLGGFGADRFYLGQWREGLGKLFSFGGLGIWTL